MNYLASPESKDPEEFLNDCSVIESHHLKSFYNR